MTKSKMLKVRIAVGCPSGTTEDWSNDTIVEVHEELIDMFSENVIEFARRHLKQPRMNEWDACDS